MRRRGGRRPPPRAPAKAAFAGASKAAWLTSPPSPPFLPQLLRDVRVLKRAVREEEGALDVVVLASRLAGVGYRVSVRSGLGGGPGADCFHQLRHEFLVVAGEGEAAGREYLVEPSFRDNFAIPTPTPRYAGLLRAVPAEVVAAPAELSRLVHLLCAEMSLAFDAHGVALPPWRQARSMQSKWLPRQARDVGVASPCDSPTAAAAGRDGGGAYFHGAALSSVATSGARTPAAVSQGDSPRAVLDQAAVALISHSSVACPRLGLKPRSLLSANLAAAMGAPPPAPAAKPVSPARGAARGAGWQEPPIRRVRMAGAVA
jgi:uncharacterized protein (TIGR01615 family)